jgi:hypothetical protein
MGWLDRLLGRGGDAPDAERAETRASGGVDDETRADVLEEEVAEERDKNALENPHPGVG